jgi:large subunit ribosomal protein L13
VRTFSPKSADIQRVWYTVDADGAVLGRLAAETARVLRGKHKAIFAPHMDTGDHVIIVNAARVVMTADKAAKKLSYHHSGYPGGLTSRRYDELLATNPAETIRQAVKGMLPKGALGRQMIKKLKVYAGPTHPHGAQMPRPLEVDHSVYRTSAANTSTR